MKIRNVLSHVFASIGAIMLVVPASVGVLLPTFLMNAPVEARLIPAAAAPPNAAPAVAWEASWGTRVIGCAARTATPFLVLNQEAGDRGRAVIKTQGAPASLSRLSALHELSRAALPAQNYATHFVVQDPQTGKDHKLSLSVSSDVVAFRGDGLDERPGTHFMWGVLTHSDVTVIDDNDAVSLVQTTDYFFIYGTTTSAEAADLAVTKASPVLAQAPAPAPAPSCYAACMAAEGARHFANLNACLAAAGIGGGAGAAVCIAGCLGTGPGYPACVTACLAAVGVTVGVLGAICVTAYCAAMLGAAIGCAIGCWTCW